MDDAIERPTRADGTDGGGAVGDADERLMNRRAAIKKAAVAATTVGVVWAAPRVEGLSLVPDYAAAGTFSGTAVANFDDTLGPGTTDWWGPNGNTVSRVVPTPGGDFTVSIPGPNRADSGANVPVTIDFSMDPPFNKICGGSFNFAGRNSPGNKNGPHPGGPLAPRGLPSSPTPTASPLSFTIPAGVNDVGPFPVGTTQWGDITFTFTFCGS